MGKSPIIKVEETPCPSRKGLNHQLVNNEMAMYCRYCYTSAGELDLTLNEGKRG